MMMRSYFFEACWQFSLTSYYGKPITCFFVADWLMINQFCKLDYHVDRVLRIVADKPQLMSSTSYVLASLLRSQVITGRAFTQNLIEPNPHIIK